MLNTARDSRMSILCASCGKTGFTDEAKSKYQSHCSECFAGSRLPPRRSGGPSGRGGVPGRGEDRLAELRADAALEREVELVLRADHRVAETIGRGRELHRDVRVHAPVVDALQSVAHVVERAIAVAGILIELDRLREHRGVDDARDEVVPGEVLVEPHRDALRLEEEASPAAGRCARGIRELLQHVVVHEGECQLQLRDDDVLVVAGIADHGDALGVALQVGLEARRIRARAGREEPREPVVEHPRVVVEIGLVVGPAPVEAVEVESWRAEVLQPVGIVVPGEARLRIEGDVVVDELAEVRVADRHAALGRRVVAEHLVDGELVDRERLLGVARSRRLPDREAAPEEPAETALVAPRVRHIERHDGVRSGVVHCVPSEMDLSPDVPREMARGNASRLSRCVSGATLAPSRAMLKTSGRVWHGFQWQH
nr:hypothetical protein [Agromyces ramosus]